MFQPILKAAGQFIAHKQRLPAPKLIGKEAGDKGVTIAFQFPPDQVSESFGGIWASDAGFGRTHPVLQYAGQESGTYRFTAMFYAETEANEILSQIKALKKAAERDSSLNRPPIWQFVWGDFLADDSVIVESVGEIEYYATRPGSSNFIGVPANVGMALDAKKILDSDNFIQGTYKTGQALSWHKSTARGDIPTEGLQLRAARMSVVLRHYEPFVVEVTDPNARTTNTFYHIVQEGDTWEHLARKYYGDPLKGDLLRRLNPAQLFLEVGQTAVILKPERFRGLAPSPGAIPLARTVAGNRYRASVFDARRRSVAIIGPEAGQ